MVGVDIPVSLFEEMSPNSQLGPLGYTFGLNQNGFLVFHPSLWMDANFLEDPAHIDIADIEGEFGLYVEYNVDSFFVFRGSRAGR